MRIALFTETYLGSINGVVMHVKTLKEGLEAMGHEVLIVCADKHAKHHYMQDGILHCTAIEAKRFYGFGIASPYSRKRQRLIAQFDPDLIHIHHEFGIGLSGIIAAHRLRKPLVYTLHTLYDHYVYYIAPKMFLRVATKFAHKYNSFVARRAIAITSPSQKGDEYLKKIGVTTEFNLIPNAADLDAFDPGKVSAKQREKLRERYAIPAEKKVALFVGRLGKEKSVDVLLNDWAANITPADNLHLLIVGGGGDEEKLRKQAAGLSIGHMVTFTGMVPHEELPAYYTICDAYVTASLSDTNSISMLEGMACGLFTLQRYDELNADQIKTGLTGCLYRTGAEMADKLREIAALSPEELARLKRTVIENAPKRGSNELATFMMGVYEKAIEQMATRVTQR